MAKRKTTRAKRKSKVTVTGEDPETKAMRDWLRTVDKPVAEEKGGAEPRDE